jgi:hypothetical protein
VARVGERKDVYDIKSDERERLENPGVDGKMIVKLVLRNRMQDCADGLSV